MGQGTQEMMQTYIGGFCTYFILMNCWITERLLGQYQTVSIFQIAVVVHGNITV